MCRLSLTYTIRLVQSGLTTAILVLSVATAPCAFGQNASDVTSDSSLVQGDTLTAVASSDPGIELLRSMVRANPDDRSFRIRLAGALFEARRYEEASEHFAVVLAASQASPRIVRHYLFSLSQTEGGLATGERVALEYSRIYPTDAEIQMRLGLFRLWMGKFRLALDACSRATRLDPGNENALACIEQAENPPHAAEGSDRIARLMREVNAAATDDPRYDATRYRLVAELIDERRFQEAWDQLLILEPRHGHSARWLDAFLDVEAGLTRPDGSSPLYPVDRATYLLRAQPNDRQIRLDLVDLLVQHDRYAEALTVLTAPGRMDVRDPDYSERLRRVLAEREDHARSRIAELTEGGLPSDADALQELTSHYLTLGNGRLALATCERLIDTTLEDVPAGSFCMKTFAGLGHTERALAQADALLRTAPGNVEIRTDVMVVRLGAGQADSVTMRTLEELLETVDDPELLLAAAGVYTRSGQFDRARDTLERLPATGGVESFANRREAAEQLIRREELRSRIERSNEQLREARRLAAEGRYDASISTYERYFEERGERSRPELKELASVHAAAGGHEQALSILFALEDQFHDADVMKRIALVQMDAGDAGGALRSLERLIADRPRDWEVRLWRADVLAELGYFEEALAIYDDVPEEMGSTYAVAVRRSMVEHEMRGGSGVGDWSGLDYAGILAPSADGVRARGGGTSYDRWGQGMQTHVTTPLGLVVLAGIDSHFLSGTRRLVPDSEIVRGRINRIWAGGIFDFTPQIRSDRASYTSRLTFEGGLFDYEGGRTMPFASVRYWRQDPGIYDGSIGIRSTEGALDLWSPAGGQYDLRLTQINAKGTTTALAPDSTIRVAGNVSVNLITDNIGSTLEGERNTGSNIRLEAGYLIANDTYLGVEYQGIDFRSTTDIYWSPQNYSQYDVFLEYEGESPLKWYLRLRAAVGMVARSDGFVTRRLEADYIRRLDDNFSLSIRTGLSASARSTGSSGASVLDRYNSASFGAALYWTL